VDFCLCNVSESLSRYNSKHMSIVNQRELEDSLLDTGDAVVVPRREIPSIEFGKDAVGHTNALFECMFSLSLVYRC
jgi:hypothetical protein